MTLVPVFGRQFTAKRESRRERELWTLWLRLNEREKSRWKNWQEFKDNYDKQS